MGHPVGHFEIGCRDAGRTREFYAKLFDWKIEPSGHGATIDTAVEGGINGHINALGHEPHHYLTIYVQVDDLQKCLNRAAELGGKTVVPPTRIPTGGSFAWMSDSDGNIIGLFQR